MDTSRRYSVGKSTLTLEFADITRSDAEVLVSSDDDMLSMSGGVSGALRAAAGNALVLDVAKFVPRTLGDVVVTTAGALPARYVFHVVTIGARDIRDDERIVRDATKRCLDLLAPLGVRSIAFPALGTGAAAYPMPASATAMANVIADHLRDTDQNLEVRICLYPRSAGTPFDYVRFYEEFARRTPSAARRPAVEPLVALPLRHGPAPILALEQQRQLPAGAIVAARPHDQDDVTVHHDPADNRLTFAPDMRQEREAAVSIFISYAHADEEFRTDLVKHLANLRRAKVIQHWHDREITAGERWRLNIVQELERAQIVLILLSPDFMASDYCTGIEARRAIERHLAGTARVIPVVLRPVDWEGSPFDGFQALPMNARPVTDWPNRDAAFLDVVRGIRAVLREAYAPFDHSAEPPPDLLA